MTTTVSDLVPVSGLGRESVSGDLLAGIGFVPEDRCAATSIMVDHHFEKTVSHDGQVEVMPLADAVVTYPWLQDLMFSLIDPDSDETLRRAFESTLRPLGTFTWVKPGAVLDKPLQSFSFMTVPQERQFVHDVTVIGEGAVVDSLSGNGVTPALTHGRHVSVSETFVGKNARIRSLDVERWGRRMDVRSYTATRLDEGAVSSSVSVAVSGVRNHVSTSRSELAAGAKESVHSVVFAPAGTHREMITWTDLRGEGARSEQVARMVSDGGEVLNESTLIGSAAGVSGFLECDGLMLSDRGYIDSVPALKARTDKAQLSHEASVGMVDEAKLDYLMAVGLEADAARDLIVQGFLDLEDQSLPASLKSTVEDLVSAARAAEM
ncbi:MAG: SufD family Fe-S cluster assembly protein [Gordonia sp. (in: high G+C Gram-positive bacteria)]|uniref:SufD family Fe-S cluster assembly protein n=1 Tax=Gordonia sp. (in: high G+C Gram-positive bacteria) TaxID=84139 RepID=UPI0039E4E25D